MTAVALDIAQKKAIKSHLQNFKTYVQSDGFRKDQDERANRVAFFQRELPEKVESLSEAEIDELVSSLWASRMWGNKQYLVEKIVSDNGIEKLRHELKLLLDNSTPVSTRYDHFLREVTYLGPASLTEMLSYIQPDACGIWNKKARQALKGLGLDGYVDPDKYRLSSREYDTFNQVLHAIALELEAAQFKNVDLLFVDYFLYEVTENSDQEVTPPTPKEAFDHDEIKDMIQSIGIMLGFDADTEVQVGHGAKVDVVWRARIGNLGLVTYVFEVHKSGSIDSLLLNLQKSKSSPTVQKVIAVSDEEQLERIKKEYEGLPEEFRRAVGFWQVGEVQKVSESLQSAIDVINKLGLVQGAF